MKIFRFFANVVVTLGLANFIAFANIHGLTHGNLYVSASGLVISFASFPRTVKMVMAQLNAPLMHYQIAVDKKFEPANTFGDDIITLNSH